MWQYLKRFLHILFLHINLKIPHVGKRVPNLNPRSLFLSPKMNLLALATSITSSALVAIAMPVSAKAFWQPPATLTCQSNQFEITSAYANSESSSRIRRPMWSWIIHIYDNSVSIAADVNGSIREPKVVRAIVNKDWVKFENIGKEITINRKTDQITSSSKWGKGLKSDVSRGKGSCTRLYQ